MQLFLTRWRITFNCYHVLNNFKFGIYTMFKAWWEKMSGSKQTRDRSEACTWCSEVIASCRYGTSRASPPHLSSTCLSNLTKKQKCKIEGTLPALAPGSQKFITTKIYSHYDSYSSKAQFKLHQHDDVLQHEYDALTYLPPWIRLIDPPFWKWTSCKG